MPRRLRSILCSWLLLVSLMSCAGASSEVITQVTNTPLATEMLMPTTSSIVKPTASPMSTDTEVPMATPTLQPTSTPTPMPSPTPVGGSAHFLMLIDFELNEYSLSDGREEILISETEMKNVLGINEQISSKNSLISGALSPDGKKFLVTLAGLNHEQGYGTTDARLFVGTTDLQVVEEIPLAPTQLLNSTWSPDSDYVLTVDNGSRIIWMINTTDNDFGVIRQVANGDHAFWSADGQHVFYSRSSSSTWYVVARDGGPNQQVVQYSSEGAGVIGVQSPNMDRLALQYWNGIAILDNAKPEPQFIKIYSAYPLTWSTDGKHLALGQNPARGVLWTFDPSQEEPTSTSLPGYPYCGRSPDGSQIMLLKIGRPTQEEPDETRAESSDSIETSKSEYTYLFFNPETQATSAVKTFEITHVSWANLGWTSPSLSCPVWIPTSQN